MRMFPKVWNELLNNSTSSSNPRPNLNYFKPIPTQVMINRTHNNIRYSLKYKLSTAAKKNKKNKKERSE